jgi:hypothetical protein
LGTILVAALSQFVQVIKARAESQFKGSGFLFARELKALKQITLRLIQMANRQSFVEKIAPGIGA